MGQDYNIYLHTAEGGGEDLAQAVKPFDSRNMSSVDNAFSMMKNGVDKAEQFAKSGFSGYINTGVAALSKAFPAVALGYALLKVGDKIVSTGVSHLEAYTGNYQYSMGWNNFKTVVSNAINPIGMIIKQQHFNAQSRVYNERMTEIRQLLGHRYIGV